MRSKVSKMEKQLEKVVKKRLKTESRFMRLSQEIAALKDTETKIIKAINAWKETVNAGN